MSLKVDWWCVKSECKYYTEEQIQYLHEVHQGTLKTVEYCKHKSAIESDKCTNAELGREVETMLMCPVLCDMSKWD